MEKFKAKQTLGASKAIQRQERLANVTASRRTKVCHVKGMDGFQKPVFHQDQQGEPAPQALYTSRYKETVGISRQG